MGSVDEEHAARLIFNQLGRLPHGQKLKVAMDIDDTVADMSTVLQRVLFKRHRIDFSKVRRSFDWWKGKTSHGKFVASYHELWNTDWKQIPPLLSREAYSMLSERTDFSFISARGRDAAEPVHKWIAHNYGKNAKIAIVEPFPYKMHGVEKLKNGYDLLVDDSPYVSASMDHELARGKTLLLVNRWDNAAKSLNHTNTAVVSDAEHAADLIFEAHEIHEAE